MCFAPQWRAAHFEVKMYKTLGVRTTFGGSDVLSRGRRKGLGTSSKVSKTWGICSISKNNGRWDIWRGSVRCIWRSRRNTEQRSGRRFPERGCILEHEIFRLLRWFCVTGAALRMTWLHFFVASAVLLNRWNWKIATRIGTRPSALLSTFHFWRKSRRTPSYLMLSTSKIGEVAQNYCCVFDAVQFENWASLAE